MNARNALVAAILALAGLVSAGCGCTAQCRPPQTRLDVIDASESARHNNDLELIGRQQVVTDAAVMTEGDRLVVYGFTLRPGSECSPLVVDFPVQRNSEERKELKRRIEAALPKAFDRYAGCLTSPERGHAGAGSGIFGGIAEGLIAADHPVASIHLVTDGCNVGEGEPACTSTMLRSGHARAVINSLPRSIKPALDGTQLQVTGLGRGTDLDAASIAVLREIFTRYGDATGATVTFQ
jgi:hypothetical protein